MLVSKKTSHYALRSPKRVVGWLLYDCDIFLHNAGKVYVMRFGHFLPWSFRDIATNPNTFLSDAAGPLSSFVYLVCLGG